MTTFTPPDINSPPPKTVDDSALAPRETDDSCVLQVSVSGSPLGWLAASGGNYLEIAAQRVNATVFRFAGAPGVADYAICTYNNVQRGLGISNNQYAQLYLPSSWWAKWMLRGQFLLCMDNLQYLGLQDVSKPYSSYLCAWNAYQALQVTRQTH